jgi:GDP/UDP-N,N'-diacetylbacillosamine 2-epimerase (hydrolysing)
MDQVEHVAVITGGRADFGLLANLCRILDEDKRIKLTVIATGSHLSAIHGYTLNEVLSYNYCNVETINLNISSDTPEDINRYISRSISNFSNFFSKHHIQKILVLGDRYEIFGASIAAAILGIKIAHIHGGEVTEGAFDEFMRHSITKMSSLHFTTHDDYSQRVRRLGENSNVIFNVGGLGAENVELMKRSLLSKAECEKALGINFNEKNLFITFHPETNKKNTLEDLKELLSALSIIQGTSVIFSMPNADTGFNEFADQIERFVGKQPECRWVFASLGQTVYFSLLQFVDAVVGNSSSGLLEAPSFNIATINIGDRQKGRVRGDTVIDVAATQSEISGALEAVFSGQFIKNVKNSVNPLFKKDTAENIARIFIDYKASSSPKSFYD